MFFGVKNKKIKREFLCCIVKDVNKKLKRDRSLYRKQQSISFHLIRNFAISYHIKLFLAGRARAWLENNICISIGGGEKNVCNSDIRCGDQTSWESNEDLQKVSDTCAEISI